MAGATSAIFTAVARADVAQVSTANTARDGSGTIATIATAGSNGSRLDTITVVATGTTTVGVVRLFIHDGSSARLYKEILVTAITPSASVEVFRSVYIPDVPIVLPTGYSLRAATNNAETFNLHVSGGDF